MRRTSLALLGAVVLLLAGCTDIKNMWSSMTAPPSQPSAAPSPMAVPPPQPQAQPMPAQPMPATARMMGPPAHKVMDTAIGKVLATNRGMTLYVSANDTMPGMSMCTDTCAANWPPLLALDDAMAIGHWTVVRRADGLKQWAYDGKPLYGWREDRQPGDTSGDGRLNGAWRAARP
jgi:predicted lipoprotein with Yx(FWY)xxD motif